MVVPLVLFISSVSLAGYAFFSEGAVLSDLMLLALILAQASLILIFLTLRAGRRGPLKWIVVDGSNVMHWKDGLRQLETVREVVQSLSSDGFSVGVVFDANAGYKIAGRYQNDYALAVQLGLPEAQVFVVPKGTQADPYLLMSARKINARVVTNDRFRDWAEAYPETGDPGFLIGGGYRAGKL